MSPRALAIARRYYHAAESHTRRRSGPSQDIIPSIYVAIYYYPLMNWRALVETRTAETARTRVPPAWSALALGAAIVTHKYRSELRTA